MDSAPPTFGTADEILRGAPIEPNRVGGDWSGEGLNLPLATSWILENWLLRRENPPLRSPRSDFPVAS